MSYQYFGTSCSVVVPARDFPVCLHDEDGAVLYDDYEGLRNRILMLNDVEKLKQYIAKDPAGALGPGVPFNQDPFFVAAEHESTKAWMRFASARPLQYIDATKTKPLVERGILLLIIACQHGHLEMACFLLDSEPPLGDIHTKVNAAIQGY